MQALITDNDMQVRTKLTSRPRKFATYVAVRYVYRPHVLTFIIIIIIFPFIVSK